MLFGFKSKSKEISKGDKKDELTKEQLKEKRLKEAKERKEIQELVMEWISIMAHKGLDNEMDETFSLSNIVKEPYGFSCNINIAKGLSFSMLESEEVTNIIQDNLGCVFFTTRVPKATYMEAKFITKDIPAIDFEPYKTDKKSKLEPYELYLATNIDGSPIIASMLEYPHLIVQGATNMGKTKMIDCVCTNLIAQNSPDDISLYIIQADKADQIIYRKCRHTRCYADDIYKIFAITNYLKEVVESRNRILRPLIEDGICDNIYTFNKVYKKYKQSKFSYIYAVIDEYSSLMPEDKDNKEDKAIKSAIQNNISRLIQIGRFCGIYLVIGVQRSTIDKLPSFIKAMCNAIATFRVNNERSSFVAIDSNEAVTLSPRESIIKTNAKFRAKTLTITPAVILEYTEKHRWSNSEYKDFPYDGWYGDFKPPSNKSKSSKIQIAPVSKNKKRKEQRYGNSNELSDEELDKLSSSKKR